MPQTSEGFVNENCSTCVDPWPSDIEATLESRPESIGHNCRPALRPAKRAWITGEG
jgi:hypothetical protein